VTGILDSLKSAFSGSKSAVARTVTVQSTRTTYRDTTETFEQVTVTTEYSLDGKVAHQVTERVRK
jgi:hypothetical protein